MGLSALAVACCSRADSVRVMSFFVAASTLGEVGRSDEAIGASAGEETASFGLGKDWAVAFSFSMTTGSPDAFRDEETLFSSRVGTGT
jgi:hypothetical protein